MPGAPFGVYVHIPFCRRRCDYCAFATWADRHHLWERYASACRSEAARAAATGRGPATSVFFGGGTPSLLPPGLLAGVLRAVEAGVGLAPGAEVTVECNPDTVDGDKLAAYAEAGVTRLSFGAQSMVPHVLASLGREHTPGNVERAVEAAAGAGFGSRYNIDLILGAAGESVADWERSLRAVLALSPAPAHVSAYALTVEPGTPLAAHPERHPDDDDQATKYLLADELLSAHGLSWYEISNWSLPGAECRHNQLYWAQGEYIGLGCAAHSHLVREDGWARRWWNVRTPERYCRLVESGERAEAAGEDLSPQARAWEALVLGLRTVGGVERAYVPDELLEEGLVAAPGNGDRAVLTARGRLLANEVALRLKPLGPLGRCSTEVSA